MSSPVPSVNVQLDDLHNIPGFLNTPNFRALPQRTTLNTQPLSQQLVTLQLQAV